MGIWEASNNELGMKLEFIKKHKDSHRPIFREFKEDDITIEPHTRHKAVIIIDNDIYLNAVFLISFGKLRVELDEDCCVYNDLTKYKVPLGKIKYYMFK